MKHLIALAGLSLAAAITPVPVLDPSLYLGRWYQIYDDFSSSLIESKYCVTADYGLNSNGTVSVHNRDRNNNVTGQETEIYGWASQDAAQQGELTVHLQGVPVAAPYWVVALGPPGETDGLYEWAVVSDDLELSLFVLARNYTRFVNYWNATIYPILINMGFNGPLNTPVATVQEGCKYWD